MSITISVARPRGHDHRILLAVVVAIDARDGVVVAVAIVQLEPGREIVHADRAVLGIRRGEGDRLGQEADPDAIDGVGEAAQQMGEHGELLG
jgi:hypothetical protein